MSNYSNYSNQIPSFKSQKIWSFRHWSLFRIIRSIRVISIIFIFYLLSFIFASPVQAAKQRVWSGAKTTTTTKTTTTASRPTFKVSFRSDRRALNVNFYSLSTASSTSYELTYMGNSLDQGVVGSINKTEGDSASRLLLFGTCSKNVCTYHKNISGMQLTITSKLNSGKTLVKRYKIKV